MKRKKSYQIPYSGYPAIRLVLLFGSGIVLGNLADINSAVLWTILIVFLMVWIVIEKGMNLKATTVQTRVAILLSSLLVITSGWLRWELQISHTITNTEKVLQLSAFEDVTMLGRVIYSGNSSSGKPRADVEVWQIDFGEGILSKERFIVRLLMDDSPDFQEADTIRFTGRLIPVSETRNPSDFDYAEYLNKRGIHIQVKLGAVENVYPQDDLLSWAGLRKWVQVLIERNFDAHTQPIAKALLLGYKQDLEGSSRQAFARAGLSHIMAVSGLHVGFILAPFWVLIPFFWNSGTGRFLAMLAIILALWFYAGLTGFPPSVKRAAVTACFLIYSKLYYKSGNSINLTATAALLLLIMNPSELLEIGFQLSFAAVFSILLILPVLQNRIPYRLREKWYGTPIMAAIISVVVQLGLYPLQVFYFGELSLISPLANALFVPALGVLVPLAMVALVITAVVPSVGYLLNVPMLWFLKAMNAFVSTVGTYEWAWTESALPGMLIFPIWLVLLLMIGNWNKPRLRWKLLSIALILILSLQMQLLIKAMKPGKLEVVIFDVGQGDAALIKTPNGKHVLIDAGVWRPGYDSGTSVILPHLKNEGISSLDAIILSHPHADHIGGVPSILQQVRVDTMYQSGFEYDSRLFERYHQLASEKRVPIRTVQAGDQIHIDPSVLFLVLGPHPSVKSSDPNQHSVVVSVIYGESEFLFTGDAGEAEEEHISATYQHWMDIDFLKVGHHGSRTSSYPAFLKFTTPEIAVVSLGERNRYRHPHPEAVRRLLDSGTRLYFTSRDRGMVFESDGTSIRRKHWE